MPSVRDDLILALEHTRDIVHRTYCTHAASGVKVGCWKECTEAADALDRARAIAERPDRESVCPDCGEDCPCYQEGANEGHSMGCNDDSCACWAAGREAGLEAQRERVG